MNMGNILIAAIAILGLLMVGQDNEVATAIVMTLKVVISWRAQEQRNINQFPPGLHRKHCKSTNGTREHRGTVIHSCRQRVE